MRASAVIVTRGDLDISELTGSLDDHFDEVIVWDNSKACKDVRVYGRYIGAMMARNEVVYVQDDDCTTHPAAIVGTFQPGQLVCNVPHDRRPEYIGTNITLMGWGSVFGKSKLSSFRRYLDVYPQDDLFERECDRVFSWLNRGCVKLVDVGMSHLPHAFGLDRMGREHRHRADMDEIQIGRAHV